MYDKPNSVIDAMRRRDSQALSAMGRAGGRAAGISRRSRQSLRDLQEEAFAQLAAERFDADERHRRESAGEHIIPLDTYE